MRNPKKSERLRRRASKCVAASLVGLSLQAGCPMMSMQPGSVPEMTDLMDPSAEPPTRPIIMIPRRVDGFTLSSPGLFQSQDLYIPGLIDSILAVWCGIVEKTQIATCEYTN